MTHEEREIDPHKQTSILERSFSNFFVPHLMQKTKFIWTYYCTLVFNLTHKTKIEKKP